MTDFSTLGLAAPLLQALAKAGYTTPTAIQAQAIPQVLARRDLIGIAQTGTGKTAAFALPLLHHLLDNPGNPVRHACSVLVLSPTRELAIQIAQSFRAYAGDQKVSIAAVFGGVPHGPQNRSLERGVDILVATPGRLIDHLDAGRLSLAHTRYLVLDEVDQMLDLGFIHAIRRVVSELPAKRQNLFFSATMPKEIRKLAAELLHDPVEVAVTPVATTVERVRQEVIFVEASRKRNILVDLFGNAEMSRTIVFTRTKRGADKVTAHLEQAGISANAIHGNKSQGQRERSLAAFKAGRVRALVATDIAARGIDIDAVSHVVNFELPEVPEAYVHRIGRTARAGAEGIAISLCDNQERDLLRGIEKLTRLRLPVTDRRSARQDDHEPVQLNEHRPGRGPKGPSKGMSKRPQRSRNYGRSAPGGGGRRVAA